MEWLFKDDNYIPKDDKDAFINKSILSVVNVLSKIRRVERLKNNRFVYNINPLLKFISSVLIILMLSLSRNYLFLIASAAFMLVQLFLLRSDDKKRIVSLGILVLLFTSIILLPSMLLGNMKNSLMIIVKSLISVSIINIFSSSVSWHDATKSLKLFLIPDIFIFVIDTAIRYIYLLGEMSLEMMYSLKLKMIGRNNSKYASLSKLMGNLFLKSIDAGNEMYYAMECRGFSGEYKSTLNKNFSYKDLVYIIFTIILIFLFMVFKGA